MAGHPARYAQGAHMAQESMHYTGQYLALTTNGKKWRGFITWTDPDGNRRKKSKTLAEGKNESKRLLTQWRAEEEHKWQQDAGRGSAAQKDRGTDTVQYVSRYIDLLEGNNSIEPSTVTGYRTSCKHIARGLEGTPIKDLEPAQIQRWEASLTRSGLSSSSVGKAHRLLHAAMRYAVNTGALDRNPTEGVKPPKRGNMNPGINALDRETCSRTLETLGRMNPTPATTAAILALCTGMRNAEVCGLQWGDYSPDADNSGAHASLHIQRAIGKSGHSTYVKRPKTDKDRTIYLPMQAVQALSAWRASQAARLEMAGAHITPDTFILGDGTGYMTPDRLTREWHTIADALGIVGTCGRRPTFHDLRHTWATLYIAAGGDAVTAANNLGHASPAMTLNVYASKDPNAQRQAPRLIEKVISGAQAGSMAAAPENGRL